MAGYKKPKKHLHREFLYLNHDTIINSLSALEAGKIDEILQKANEAREGGISANVVVGPVAAGGGKRKTANIEEEMVRTRTVFSAFDAWYQYLREADAIGTFDEWSIDVRNELEVGDTIEFTADLTLTPVHKILRTYLSFAAEAAIPGSLFHQKGEALAETKRVAVLMMSMLGGKDAPQHLPVYMAPLGTPEPRILARLDDEYIVSPKEAIEGTYKVIAQVDQILSGEQSLSAIRVVRDVPPTPVEVKTISEALANFKESAEALGVIINDDDITVPAPAVLVRPIAVFR